jgi:hypothetical protein
MELDQDQLWACKACKTVRAWGTGAPLDPASAPLLQCARCGGPERFVYVVEDPSAVGWARFTPFEALEEMKDGVG